MVLRGAALWAPVALGLHLMKAGNAAAEEDCNITTWLDGYGCEDTPGFTDAYGYNCFDYDNNCVGMTVTWGYEQEVEDAVIENCPVSCGICPCQDRAGFVDAFGNGCSHYDNNCIGLSVTPGHNETTEASVIRHCPKSCGVCQCWTGCFQNSSESDRRLLDSVRHLMRQHSESGSPTLRFGPGGWFTVDLLNAFYRMFATELLGIPTEIPATPHSFPGGLEKRAYDVQLELWPGTWKNHSEGIEVFEIGFNGFESVFFSGVRYSDCDMAYSARCTDCEPTNVQAGTCATRADCFELYSGHFHERARDFFPASGELTQNLQLEDFYTTWTSHGHARFVPSHCQQVGAQPCMEMFDYGMASTWWAEVLIERSGFPYEVVLYDKGWLRSEVEHRLERGLGAVFTWWEPDPWVVKVKATAIAFPFALSSCGDPSWGYGTAIGCQGPQKPLRNAVNSYVRAVAPGFYHALRGPLRITPEILEEMMQSHVDGGGDIEDSRLVACGWMRRHVDVVRSWLPLHCGNTSKLLIQPDGSTGCCAGDVRQLVPDGPMECVPVCDPATQRPNAVVGRCDPLCPEGSLLSSDAAGNSSVCEPCPAGTVWEPVPDPLFTGVTAMCRPCAAGSFSPVPGGVRCSICLAGTFAPANSSACLPCSNGTEHGEPGQESCPCARGFFKLGNGRAGLGEACSPCPGSNQTTLFAASTSPDQCICTAGHLARPQKEADAGSGSNASLQKFVCEECTKGLTCAAGMQEPRQVAGYYVDVLDAGARTYSVYHCRSERECISGPLGTCAPGRFGRACAKCLDDHYPAGDGSCERCDSGDLMPVIFVGLGCFAVLGALALVSGVDATQQRLTVATAAIVGGQLASALQALGVFQTLSVQWENPVRAILQILSVLAFDVDVVKINCVMGVDRPILNFAFRLLLYPMFACSLAIVMGSLYLARKPMDLNRYLNANGLLLLMLYVTLTLTALLPFICLPNPNGTSAMGSNPGIVCWEGGHIGFFILGIIGVAAYPMGILAIVLRVTLRYPALIASGQGMSLVRRYRWLFSRFKASCYWFGAVFLLRAALLALTPVLFPAKHVEQVLFLGSLLLVYSGLQSHHWPWRTSVANYADAGMNVGLMLCALGAAFLAPTSTYYDAERSEAAVSGFVFATVLLVMVSFVTAILWVVFRHIRPAVDYSAFLCHHKGGAAVMARYLKCRLGAVSSGRIFIDSDNLMDLDSLFDTVRRGTRNLVVLGTKEILLRMWCAGEITTAMHNRVPALVVVADDYNGPDEALLDSLDQVWTAEELHSLCTFGMDLPKIKEAYRRLDGVTKIVYPRFGSVEMKDVAVESIAKNCKMLWRSAQPRRPSVDAVPEFVLAGNPSDAEAISTCLVLSYIIKQQTIEEVAIVHTRGAYRSLPRGSTTKSMSVAPVASITAIPKFNVVVVLTKGLLREPSFAELLLEVIGDAVNIATVLADRSFDFPGADFYAAVKAAGLGVPGLGSKEGPALAEAYQALLKVLALPLSSHASIGLISRQVEEIVARIRARRHAPAVAPALSDGARQGEAEAVHKESADSGAESDYASDYSV